MREKLNSPLATEISEASSPISTNISHVIRVCPRRASIHHQRDELGPVLQDLPSSAHGQYPHKVQRFTSKAQLPAWFRQAQVTHPQTNPFQENKCQSQSKELLKVSSCPGEHAAAPTSPLSRTIPGIRVHCFSKYSRTSPSSGKVDLKLYLPHTQRPILKRRSVLTGLISGLLAPNPQTS